MIRSYGVPSHPIEKRLLEIERTATIEESNDGFDYYVGDPELIGHRDEVIGIARLLSDSVELELVVGEDVPKPARQVMVDILVDSVSDHDRYGLSKAIEQRLDNMDPQISQLAYSHIASNIHNQQRVTFAKNTHPLTRDTIRSTLGWVSTTRITRTEGLEALDALDEAGLYVPHFNSDLRLGGAMTTKQGIVPVGITRTTEKSERHHCENCTGQILKQSPRITLTLDRPRTRFDHHHFHNSCFAETQLPRLSLDTAKIEPNAHALGLKR